jgi:hypothetical protein
MVLSLPGSLKLCLFTNKENATSNAIYQTIGYRFVGDYRMLTFISTRIAKPDVSP